jgi:SAM-dependent methyltransferase
MTREHWQSVYLSKHDAELSWFEDRPAWSLEIVRSLPSMPRSAIDIGGGQSYFAGELLQLGVESVTVLDISLAALERGKARLGADAARVAWMEGNILDHAALGPYELWHDRACLHFLTDDADRRRYAEIAARGVVPGGFAIVAGFAPDGPERCSGLPVRRADAESLAAEFASAFTLARSARASHTTPWGKPQAFEYALLRRE